MTAQRKVSPVARAKAEMDAMDGCPDAGHHGRRFPGASPKDIKQGIYAEAQQPGSIAFLDNPNREEAGAATVIVVSGGGVMLRVALGRNRTANLINQLVAALA